MPLTGDSGRRLPPTLIEGVETGIEQERSLVTSRGGHSIYLDDLTERGLLSDLKSDSGPAGQEPNSNLTDVDGKTNWKDLASGGILGLTVGLSSWKLVFEGSKLVLGEERVEVVSETLQDNGNTTEAYTKDMFMLIEGPFLAAFAIGLKASIIAARVLRKRRNTVSSVQMVTAEGTKA